MIFDQYLPIILTGIVAALASFCGSYIMWRLIGPIVVRRGIKNELGPAMLNWLFEPSIKTGEKIVEKHEKADGTIVDKEVPEILAPAEVLASKMGRVVWNQFRGKLVGDGVRKATLINDVQAELANPDSPFSQFAGFLSPKARERALKDGDYVPVLLDLIVSSPQARELVSKTINKLRGQSLAGSDTSGPAGVSGKTW